jgi:hypothetical protein
MANMVECWVCGKEHEYCPTCGQTHGWKYVADTVEHYQIHMTIEDYRCGVLTKEQAIEVFADKCGVHASDDLSWMLPHVEKGVREIIGEKERERTTKTTRKNKLY